MDDPFASSLTDSAPGDPTVALPAVEDSDPIGQFISDAAPREVLDGRDAPANSGPAVFRDAFFAEPAPIDEQFENPRIIASNDALSISAAPGASFGSATSAACTAIMDLCAYLAPAVVTDVDPFADAAKSTPAPEAAADPCGFGFGEASGVPSQGEGCAGFNGFGDASVDPFADAAPAPAEAKNEDPFEEAALSPPSEAAGLDTSAMAETPSLALRAPSSFDSIESLLDFVDRDGAAMASGEASPSALALQPEQNDGVAAEGQFAPAMEDAAPALRDAAANPFAAGAAAEDGPLAGGGSEGLSFGDRTPVAELQEVPAGEIDETFAFEMAKTREVDPFASAGGSIGASANPHLLTPNLKP